MRHLAPLLPLLLLACSHQSELDAIGQRKTTGPKDEPPPPGACELAEALQATRIGPLDGAVVPASNAFAERLTFAFELRVGQHAQDVTVEVDGVVDAAAATRLDAAKGAAHAEVLLAEGPHTLSATCTDSTGWKGTAEVGSLEVDLSPCTIDVLAPADGSSVTDADDLDAEVDGVQLDVKVEVGGDDCRFITIATCDDFSFSEHDELTGKSGTGQVSLVARGSAAICVGVSDDLGNTSEAKLEVTYAGCAPDAVDCAGTCRTDTATNARACGAQCLICPTTDMGEAACSEGKCTLTCARGFHLEDGECRSRPGCTDLDQACRGDDCCAIDLIHGDAGPLRFQRGADASGEGMGIVGYQVRDPDAITELSEFSLDRYEVTVSRFRRFLANYNIWRGNQSQSPRGGQGGHPSGAAGSGWVAEWKDWIVDDGVLKRKVSPVPVDNADFESRITVCNNAHYTRERGANENLPINCISFYEAYLFCIWDFGRLPTEAEWNYAAAGGAEQRSLPWSDPPEALTLDKRYVEYGGQSASVAVGSRPAGVGRYGTMDLAGSVFEWVRDSTPLESVTEYIAQDQDPIDLRRDLDEASGARHVLRGGSYLLPAQFLRTAYRQLRSGINRLEDVGARCARPARAL